MQSIAAIYCARTSSAVAMQAELEPMSPIGILFLKVMFAAIILLVVIAAIKKFRKR